MLLSFTGPPLTLSLAECTILIRFERDYFSLLAGVTLGILIHGFTIIQESNIISNLKGFLE